MFIPRKAQILITTICEQFHNSETNDNLRCDMSLVAGLYALFCFVIEVSLVNKNSIATVFFVAMNQIS